MHFHGSLVYLRGGRTLAIFRKVSLVILPRPAAIHVMNIRANAGSGRILLSFNGEPQRAILSFTP